MIIFRFILLLLPFCCLAKNAVTFGWGGRLGDNLVDYTHAKWVSYKWNIPLLFKTFEYSDQFVFDDVEEKLTPEHEKSFNTVIVKSIEAFNRQTNIDTLYFIPHTFDSYDEYISNRSKKIFIHVDWSDSYFRNMMIQLIAPKNPLTLHEPPKEIITVALHFRCGGSFSYDIKLMKTGSLRFPNISYYFQQLSKLHELVNHQPMYVYIFTDHDNPAQVYSQLKNKFASSNIEFHFREANNRHDANVLEDLFSMTKFDCLIRPCSHYSMMASHLGDFKIEIYPKRGFNKNHKFVVSEVGIIRKGSWDANRKEWVD